MASFLATTFTMHVLFVGKDHPKRNDREISRVVKETVSRLAGKKLNSTMRRERVATLALGRMAKARKKSAKAVRAG